MKNAEQSRTANAALKCGQRTYDRLRLSSVEQHSTSFGMDDSSHPQGDFSDSLNVLSLPLLPECHLLPPGHDTSVMLNAKSPGE
jgi:hypothetical protein